MFYASSKSIVRSLSQSREMDDMNLIVPPNAGVGGIYLGNMESASSQALHNQHKIGAILSMCPQQIPSQIKQNLILHHICFADDVDGYRIDKHFEETFNFIEKARKVTNILIHCMAGISRSVTVLIAYLVRKERIGVKEAMDCLQSKRWQIYPNNGFLRQLSEFERKVFLPDETRQERDLRSSDYFEKYRREYGRSIDALSSKVQDYKNEMKMSGTYTKLSQYQKEREELERRFQRLKDRNQMSSSAYHCRGKYKDANNLFSSGVLNY